VHGCPSGWPIHCPRRIGWCRSWFSEHCREHDATPLLRHRIGYWVRPYDDHLDARRWRWQQPGCWRASRAGRAMAARLTKLLNDRSDQAGDGR